MFALRDFVDEGPVGIQGPDRVDRWTRDTLDDVNVARLGLAALPLVLAVIVACSPINAVSPKGAAVSDAHAQAEEQLPAVVAPAATAAIDPTSCEKVEARLRPFIINWDATEQAELTDLARESLIVVKLKGCSLEVLPTCRVPGEYRFHETPGNLQTLHVTSDTDLHAKLPLSFVSLSGQLKKSGGLSLEYFVRGMQYATAPALNVAQLGKGCEGATHFVLNVAAGAFELSASTTTTAGASADAHVASGSASNARSSSALFRGGSMGECEGQSTRCRAPVRLRLLELETTPMSPEVKAVADLAITKPKALPAGAAPPPPLHPRQVFARANAAVHRCIEENAGQGGVFKTKVSIGADGVPTDVTLSGAEQSPGLATCVRDVLMSLRFEPQPKARSLAYPYVVR